ncbi:hypothetical protein LSUB1_G006896 [Lachnellula subtilissima]|uniref:Azaphilone pigments biosynthesis cluster protein L N-terminal domain-containing protein n=1 Tax=Lachnellula subtilissima TaxID=602034 RepID=A0A8H8RKX0_9HELO|nr:hypothetical protein LSUB1_G006896 [Lachnellula subtilissima]
MADPLSTASGILTLTVFAFQSSRVLYQTVASFQHNQRTIRQLKEELEALSGALEALQETVTNADVDLTILRLPLLRCGRACEEFEALIVKCTAHSGGSKTSFRDWAKLRYMGDDIDGFKNMLAGYKSTIMIALGDANMVRTKASYRRTSAITMSVLKEYKDMITNTTVDLEEHLQEINDRLRTFSPPNPILSIESAAEQRQIQEERDSTQQCLKICAQVVTHIDQLQPTVFEDISTSPGAYQTPHTKLEGHSSARLFTADTFKTCKAKLSDANTKLESHLQDIDSRLRILALPGPRSSNEQAAEQEKIKEELDSIKQCLTICAQASTQANKERMNVFEDISTADDGHQVLVSTIGDLVSARRVTAGTRSRQWLGQMSDDSLQQLSHNYGHVVAEEPVESQAEASGHFEGRYGTGLTLNLADSKGK